MALRNITTDLRDRLAAVDVEIKRLTEQASHLRALLAAEGARWAPAGQPTLFPLGAQTKAAPARRRPVAEPSEKTKFLNDLLETAGAPLIDKIAETAVERGLDFDGKSPGRVLHFVLVGMIKRGLVTPARQWQLASFRKRKGRCDDWLDITPPPQLLGGSIVQAEASHPRAWGCKSPYLHHRERGEIG